MQKTQTRTFNKMFTPMQKLDGTRTAFLTKGTETVVHILPNNQPHTASRYQLKMYHDLIANLKVFNY